MTTYAPRDLPDGLYVVRDSGEVLGPFETVEALYDALDATSFGFEASDLRRASGKGTTMPYVLHYISQDGPEPDSSWSVYAEDYHDAETDVPIDGSQRWLSSHPSEAEANAEAHRLQVTANL